MGWYYIQGADRKGIIEQIKSDHDPKRCTILKTAIYGNQFWCLTKMNDDLGGETFIELFLLQSGKEYGWGYKPMEEACGPFYYACPLSWLALAKETSPNWRAGVRKWHADRNRKLEVNKFYNVGGSWKAGNTPIKQIFLISLKPLRATWNGWDLKMKRKMLKDLTLADQPVTV